MRRALVPSRSDTRLDSLMCASSSSDSNRLCSCTRLRVIWYLRRITVRQSRCSASGTKLKVSSWATRRFTRPFGIRKVLFAPAGARDSIAPAQDGACPTAGSRLSRVRRTGRQYCSNASHTGRQYCAVDSITTSSTSRSTSQSASARRSGGAGPDLLAFKVVVAVDLDVGHHDGQHLLVHVNSRDSVRHRPLLAGAESVPRRISQGRGLSPALTRGATTPNYSVNHARSGSNSCSASMAPWLDLDLAAPARAILPSATIFIRFRGPAGPAATSCGNRPEHPASSSAAYLSQRFEGISFGRRFDRSF